MQRFLWFFVNDREHCKCLLRAATTGKSHQLASTLQCQHDKNPLRAPQAPAPGTEASCNLTTELEEGPYWLDDIMFRSNITEEQPGIPLLLRIKIANADCEPVVDAFVDIWQCNSTGFYSAFTCESATSLA